MASATIYQTDSASANGSDVRSGFNESLLVILDEMEGEGWGWGDGDSQKGEVVALVAVYVPVMVVAVFGNLVVLGVVLTDRRMRRSAPNFFLCNLALADLLVGLICVPITAVRYLYQVWIFGEFLCKATAYLQGISIVSSVLTIVCMAADRYFAILRPMRNRQVFSVRRVRYLVVLTWMVAALIVLPFLLVRKVEYHHLGLHHLALNAVEPLPDMPDLSVQYCTEDWPSSGSRQLYDCVFVCVVFVLPGTLTVALYARMGTRLWAQDQTLARTNSYVASQCHRVVTRRRLALMMMLVSVLFAVCWLPYSLINLCLTFQTEPWDWLLPLYPFSLLLAHSNSALNPVLYGLVHRSLQQVALRLLCCQWKALFRKGTFSSQQSERTQLQGSLRTSHRDSGRRDVTPDQEVNAV